MEKSKYKSEAPANCWNICEKYLKKISEGLQRDPEQTPNAGCDVPEEKKILQVLHKSKYKKEVYSISNSLNLRTTFKSIIKEYKCIDSA